MAAGKRDILIEQGTGFSETWLFKPGGVAADLTGYTFSGQIRRTIESAEILASFTFTILDQTQTATKGKVVISLTGVQTAAIRAGHVLSTENRIVTYAYDMEYTQSGGQPTRFAEGAILFSAEVTR